MAPPPPLTAAISLLLLLLAVPAFSSLTSNKYITTSVSKKSKGESKIVVDMKYHNGTILSSEITIHPIWYGNWNETQKCILRDFIRSISPAEKSVEPSVSSWWNTVRLYDDKDHAHVNRTVRLGTETNDTSYSHGKTFTRLTLPSIITSAIANKSLPVDPTGASVYLMLTSEDVVFDEFCRAICGFHGNLTSPLKGGKPLPYAWVGNSGKQCPGKCAFPFFAPLIPGVNYTAQKPPNGDVGADGMVIVLAHELAEVATNTLGDGWYAGNRNEIADLCEGVYGSGGGGSYTGQMLFDNKTNAAYNVNGCNGRKFLAPWLWDRHLKKCNGPNAIQR